MFTSRFQYTVVMDSFNHGRHHFCDRRMRYGRFRQNMQSCRWVSGGHKNARTQKPSVFREGGDERPTPLLSPGEAFEIRGSVRRLASEYRGPLPPFFAASSASAGSARFTRRPAAGAALKPSARRRSGMRNARSEPMPPPGPTESFYTLSSLLSQFYSLFHFISIGHSSLEHTSAP